MGAARSNCICRVSRCGAWRPRQAASARGFHARRQVLVCFWSQDRLQLAERYVHLWSQACPHRVTESRNTRLPYSRSGYAQAAAVTAPVARALPGGHRVIEGRRSVVLRGIAIAVRKVRLRKRSSCGTQSARVSISFSMSSMFRCHCEVVETRQRARNHRSLVWGLSAQDGAPLFPRHAHQGDF